MFRTLGFLIIFLLAATPVQAQQAAAQELSRLAPIYRHTILVSDLERSLELYRDILGMKLNSITDVGQDSYGSTIFNIAPGAMVRFAYLDGENGSEKIFALAEVPDFKPSVSDGPRAAAWVLTVADVEGVMKKVEALGLTLLKPYEFVSKEAGKLAMETAFVDFDGHLIVFYGLKHATESKAE